MGLDDLVKGALGGSGGDGGSTSVVGQVGRLIDRAGGLDGLVAKLQAAGLGDEAASWIGNGDNAPVSGDELRSALGDDALRGAGADPEHDSGGIAAMLPRVVDGLTPGGAIPGGDQLEGLLRRLTG